MKQFFVALGTRIRDAHIASGYRLLVKTRPLLMVSGVSLIAVLSSVHAQVKEVWVARYPSEISCKVDDLILSDAGTVYVTATVGKDDPDSPLLAYELTTIKYDADGGMSWAKRFDDREVILGEESVLHPGDTIYITGTSSLNAEYREHDYVTIKYSKDGEELWYRFYDNGAEDWANGIVVDDAGNSYVTGDSEDLITGKDYATLRYDAVGNQIWVRRYDRSGNEDMPFDIAIDRQQNVYVAGGSTDAETGADFTTVKYNAMGVLLWVRHYDGEHSGADIAHFIEIDSQGYVYVSGISAWRDDSRAMDEENADYVTTNYMSAFSIVKYDIEGNQIWAKSYEHPPYTCEEFQFPCGNAIRGFAIDNRGNSYLTGNVLYSGYGYDFLTVKYDQDGNLLWDRRFDASGAEDVPADLAVDSLGRVYVTGRSSVPEAIYGERSDFATVAYSADGEELWVIRYDSAEDYSEAIAVDAEGQVFVTGESRDPLTAQYDCVTIKYRQQERENEGGGGSFNLAVVLALLPFAIYRKQEKKRQSSIGR